MSKPLIIIQYTDRKWCERVANFIKKIYQDIEVKIETEKTGSLFEKY